MRAKGSKVFYLLFTNERPIVCNNLLQVEAELDSESEIRDEAD